MSIREGDHVGTYEVIRRLAAGGTAEVWEVRHASLDSRHALKVLLPHLVVREDIRQRFLREGKLQSTLDHPNIVRVTDLIAEPGVAGLVMDLLDGEALDEVLERVGVVAPDDARRWLVEILDAMGHAHSHGVIHRDLKPANLFLTQSGAIKVLDFGIAKITDQRQTGTQATLGTAAFMSPEQVASPASVDHRTDIFSLGAVLYELVTGTNAFEGDTVFDTMQRVVAGNFRPPSAIVEGLPTWVDAVVARAMAVQPDDRFQSTQDFRDAMFSDIEAPAPRAAAPAAPPASRRIPWAAIGGSFVAATALAGGLWWSTHRTLVHDATLQVNACGLWTLDVRAQGAYSDLTIRRNGDVIERRSIYGEQTLNFSGRASPNQPLTMDIGFPSGPALRRSEQVPAFDGNLDLPQRASWPHGRVPAVPVRIKTPCSLPRGLRWTATIGPDEHKGTVSAGRFVLPTSGLAEGVWPVSVSVFMGDDVLLSTDTTLEVTAPCVDQDGDGYTTCDGDCNDTRTDIHPNANEIPNDGLDNDCKGGDGIDADGDGFSSVASGGQDCDDRDRRVHPRATESSAPNGKDDDCDGTTDEDTVAYDDDGDGYSERDGDCNDADATTHPNASELPDCRDQDCDGDIDEGVSLVSTDDGFEPNDARSSASDLGTNDDIQFRRTLDLVTREPSDEEWFQFHSDDGPFDDWGIDIIAEQLPVGSSFAVEVYDGRGTKKGATVLARDGQSLQVRGKGLYDDSGDYLLRVVPKGVAKPWCPVKIRVVSR